MAVLDNELHSVVLRVHISHFTFETRISHDSRRKNNCKVFGRHLEFVSTSEQCTAGHETYQVLTFSHSHAGKMKYQEFEAIAVLRG